MFDLRHQLLQSQKEEIGEIVLQCSKNIFQAKEMLFLPTATMLLNKKFNYIFITFWSVNVLDFNPALTRV